MTWTESGQTLSPARPQQEIEDQEPPLDSPYLKVYLSKQLIDLRKGFEYRGEKISPDLANDLVDTHLEHIFETLYQVASREKSESLVYFDHPTQEDNYLSQAQEESGLDYELLDFVYRRCFYSFIIFTTGDIFYNLPKDREGLADYEAQYLQKDREMNLSAGNLNVAFICLVKPIQVGENIVYQRRWLVRPGQAESREEQWQRMFGRLFPRQPDLENSFVVYETDSVNPDEAIPDHASVIYCDKETGKPLREYSVSIRDWLAFPKEIEREIAEFTYEPVIYQNPITNERVEAERQTTKTWSASEDWFRRKRRGCYVKTLVFEDWEDNSRERKVERVLEDSDYESQTADGAYWVEEERAIMCSEGIVTYKRNYWGEMVLSPVEINQEVSSIPENLGTARAQYFPRL